ncbi:MAG: M1 family metallopeptidase [bacterium]
MRTRGSFGLLVACLVAVAAWSEGHAAPDFKIKRHSLEVELQPQAHTLSAVDAIEVVVREPVGPIRLFLNRNLSVQAVTSDGRELPFRTMEEYDLSAYVGQIAEDTTQIYENAQLLQVNLPAGPGEIELKVSYDGVIYDSLRSAAFSRTQVADQTSGLIGEEGIFLSPEGYWYPDPADEGLTSFRVSVTTPENLEVITQGRRLERRVEGAKRITVWDAVHPSDGLYLVAGRYEIKERQLGNITVYTFFFPESQDLAEKYLEFSARYLEMYGQMLGPYPYAKFAVVENFFPTGYGMPSYTLLGSQVIRLPFIVYTSLGHEVCHNWWGNSVFVDEGTGNWCEGLTTYCADFHYKELKSPEEARAYRLNIDKDYTVYVTEENDFPLSEFEERTTPASRAIGYGKSAMLFHQVRRMIGEEQFYKALRSVYESRRFQRAGWSNFQRAFEAASGQDLGWFFDQWVRRSGAPLLTVSDVDLRESNGTFIVTALIRQETENFRLFLPVVLETSRDTLTQIVEINGTHTIVSFESADRPVALKVDPDYDVFRRLDYREVAPSISLVMGDKNRIIVIPTRGDAQSQRVYRTLADRINRTREAEVMDDTEVAEEDLKENSLFVFGGPGENRILDKVARGLPEEVALSDGAFTLFGEGYTGSGHCLVAVFRNPFNDRKGVCLLWGLSPEAIEAAGHKIVHYGKYGYLVFDNGVNVAKGQWEVKDNPMVYRF